MNFGQALEALKAGDCVRRAGWNGKGMHLYIEDSLYRSMPRADVKGKITYTDQGKYAPCICMFTAQKVHQPGWLASQPDMLAEDWEVLTWEELSAA
ncbi:MAG: DUF2829 domain-containing protein [Mesorhizobium sp.]|uniref:DUF2829 domain-containing protein n=1 Tax=Mesorhizobium sp. TaxID=1871066 RepID=UPI00120587F6|nr:DUF2829 domain-containing protein [Mesorhizobium sp.]TIM14492.1 MAG: DUF2829 domain-containing protein [Mesorhizobium sp.]